MLRESRFLGLHLLAFLLLLLESPFLILFHRQRNALDSERDKESQTSDSQDDLPNSFDRFSESFPNFSSKRFLSAKSNERVSSSLETESESPNVQSFNDRNSSECDFTTTELSEEFGREKRVESILKD